MPNLARLPSPDPRPGLPRDDKRSHLVTVDRCERLDPRANPRRSAHLVSRVNPTPERRGPRGHVSLAVDTAPTPCGSRTARWSNAPARGGKIRASGQATPALTEGTELAVDGLPFGWASKRRRPQRLMPTGAPPRTWRGRPRLVAARRRSSSASGCHPSEPTGGAERP